MKKTHGENTEQETKKTNENRFLRVRNSSNDVFKKNNEEYARYNYIESAFTWQKRSLGYFDYLYTNTLRYQLKRGEVYEIDFGCNVGSELNERHYAVVLHDSNETSQNILVCPLTTKRTDGGDNALINIGRLPNVVTNDDSYAKLSQIRTIDKVRIYLRPVMNKDHNDQNFTKRIGPVSVLTNDQYKQVIDSFTEVLSGQRRI